MPGNVRRRASHVIHRRKQAAFSSVAGSERSRHGVCVQKKVQVEEARLLLALYSGSVFATPATPPPNAGPSLIGAASSVVMERHPLPSQNGGLTSATFLPACIRRVRVRRCRTHCPTIRLYPPACSTERPYAPLGELYPPTTVWQQRGVTLTVSERGGGGVRGACGGGCGVLTTRWCAVCGGGG